jgi:hypothetical protein
MGMKPGATPQAREAGWRACAALADARAAALAPVISEIRSSGITSAVCIAAALSARGIPTPRGYRVWRDGTVRKLLDRMDRMAAAGALGSGAVAMAQEPERRLIGLASAHNEKAPPERGQVLETKVPSSARG